MGYWLLRDNHAEYAVDWDVVYRIIRSFHTSALRLSNYSIETTDVWSVGPTLRHYSFDWDTIRSRALLKSNEDFARLSERATVNMRDVQAELAWMVEGTQKLTGDFTGMMRGLQQENIARVETLQSRWESAADVARMLRDASAETVVIGAGMMTGGGAIAALGAGSVMKGAFKYQDTESLGGALMTASGTFAFGLVKLGAAEELKNSFAQRSVLIVLQSMWDTGAALAEGKPLGDAAAAGSAKMMSGFAGDILVSNALLKLPIAKTLFEKAGALVTVTVMKPDGASKLVSADLLQKLTGKAFESGMKDQTKQFFKEPENYVGKVATGVGQGWSFTTNVASYLGFGEGDPVEVPRPPADPRRDTTLLSSATLRDDLLLRLAIVNMKDGIDFGVGAPGGRR